MSLNPCPEARRALRLCMESLSQAYFFVPWRAELDLMLWDWVQQWRERGPIALDDFEPDHARDYEARMLSWLADRAGGWWRREAGGVRFIPMAEWLRIYRDARGP